MNDRLAARLHSLKDELEGINSTDWSDFEPWIAKATPIIKAFWPAHFDDFLKVTKTPHWVQLPRVGRIGEPYDNPFNLSMDQTENAANENLVAEVRRKTLNFLDGVLEVSSIQEEIESRTSHMSKNTVEEQLAVVLKAMSELAQGPSGSYVTDSSISQRTGIAIDDVRDYMDILDRRGMTDEANSADSHCAKLTAQGRMTLRDASFKVTHSAPSIVVQGNQGVIVNAGSTLKNVSQIVNLSRSLPNDTKQELTALIQQLNEALKHTPPEQVEEAEAVAETAKALVEQVSKEKPNRHMLSITGEGLKQAAKNLSGVVDIVAKIVALTQGTPA